MQHFISSFSVSDCLVHWLRKNLRSPKCWQIYTKLYGIITNKVLWRSTKQKPTEIQIKRRKWNCIGHTLCKETGAIEKTALDWNPQGYRRRGRSQRTWRRTIEDEIRNTGRSWNEVKEITGDRSAWKLFTDALFSTRSKELMMIWHHIPRDIILS